mgnify:CR=1 FL=1|tara:strand:- start:732 stop:1052 length:321 start_codon:yes stop_codon:yes gene_type:complete
MNLIFTINGEIQDCQRELEIFNDDNPFGFNCIVIYKEGVWKDIKFAEKHNVTEVHYLYKTYESYSGKRCAFESDIHRTGMTVDLKEIDAIIVTKATCMYQDFNVCK